MTAEIIIYYIILPAFIVLSAIFSGSETSLISASSIKLKVLSEAGKKRASKSLHLLDNMEETLGMILIGNNLANVGATSFIVFLVAKTISLSEYTLLYVTLAQTLFFLIFCEVLPKTIARSKAYQFLMLFSYPVSFLMLILKPLVKLSLLFSEKLKKILQYKDSPNILIGSRDEIGTLFKMGEEEGIQA